MPFRWLAIAVLIGMLTGCQNPAVQARHARRAEHREQTIDMLRESEAQRGEKLARTMTLIEKTYERDCRRAGENVTILKKWWADQFKRWEEARPVHAQRFREIMAGNPDSMHRTLPMFMD